MKETWTPVDKGEETRENKGDKWTQVLEKEERLCDWVEGVILINRRDSLNIQEVLKFE